MMNFPRYGKIKFMFQTTNQAYVLSEFILIFLVSIVFYIIPFWRHHVGWRDRYQQMWDGSSPFSLSGLGLLMQQRYGSLEKYISIQFRLFAHYCSWNYIYKGCFKCHVWLPEVVYIWDIIIHMRMSENRVHQNDWFITILSIQNSYLQV